MLSFFPQDVLDEILNLIESVSEGFLPTLTVVLVKQNFILYLNMIKLDQIFDIYTLIVEFDLWPYCTMRFEVTCTCTL